MVCMFSHWTKVFLCRLATDTSLAKIPLQKIIPTWGTPVELHSDWGTHFISQVLQQVCAVWSVLHHFYCAYDHQSSGLVGHTNGTIKIQMVKFV